MPRMLEHAEISVEPRVQGTSATVADYGFINLPDELITALAHSEGGNLNCLGKQEAHTKDFMHFELKSTDFDSRLPGEQGAASPKKTAP